MKWVWGGVLAIVLLFGAGLTEWEVLRRLLDSGGTVDEEGASLIAFIAGYTLPLTAGAAFAALLFLRGAFASMEHPAGPLLIIAGILFCAGLLAAYFGLGLLPEYEYKLPSGPPYVSIPLWVLQGYFNTYGWTLMICAFAIGIAIALHIDAWYRAHASPGPQAPQA